MSQGPRISALDGVRFLAFTLVFLRHFTGGGSPWFAQGWMGVDIFFALSAFLFIGQFQKEYLRDGRISVSGYFVRRFFRIYPLMILFALYMMWSVGTGSADEWLRVLGLVLSIDNIIHALHISGRGIPMVEHLWSLSYEFQTYLVLPVIFLISTRVHRRTTILLLLGAAFYCALARVIVSELGVEHPTVYALPFFRPESIIAGLVLAYLKPTWHWGWSVSLTAVALTVFMILPAQPDANRWAWTFSYPVLGLLCFGLIDSALRSPLKAVFSSAILAHIGTRTYAMYIFHIVAISYAARVLNGRLGADMSQAAWVAMWFVLAYALAFLWAEMSYWVLERWTEKAGKRVAEWADPPRRTAPAPVQSPAFLSREITSGDIDAYPGSPRVTAV